MLPLTELPAKLEWSLEEQPLYWEATDREKVTGKCLRFHPHFPACNPALDEDILWDLLELFASTRTPGAYSLLNCSCGVSEHAGIDKQIFVSHPSPDSIVWEIDTRGLAPALAPTWHSQSGFLRLIFGRDNYQASIQAMIDAAKTANSAVQPVEELEPNKKGLAFEELLAADGDGTLGKRRPLFSPGNTLEIGCFGSELLLLNGRPERRWPAVLFPRWQCDAAFDRWIGFLRRGYGLTPEAGQPSGEMDFAEISKGERLNDFFLLSAALRNDCNAAGEELAAQLRAAWIESGAAPGVRVLYLPITAQAIFK
jgi:hypothetical protein